MYKFAEEDYIKFIYEYSMNHQTAVQVKHISEYFNYSDQSVYEMVKKLQEQGLVVYQPYKGIHLSDKGIKEAIRMIRSHRIWEVFLKEYLGYSWEEVHDEAEFLEHASSDELLKRLYIKLGSPKTCQHGNPIPDFSGQVEHISMIALADVKEGNVFEIQKVLDNTQLLTFLKSVSVQLYDKIMVVKKHEFQELLEIKVCDNMITLSLKTASMIYGVNVSHESYIKD